MSGGRESVKNYVGDKFRELLNGSFSLIQLYTEDVRIEYIHRLSLVAEETVKKIFHEHNVLTVTRGSLLTMLSVNFKEMQNYHDQHC
jgi:hypothetical protein